MQKMGYTWTVTPPAAPFVHTPQYDTMLCDDDDAYFERLRYPLLCDRVEEDDVKSSNYNAPHVPQLQDEHIEDEDARDNGQQ